LYYSTLRDGKYKKKFKNLTNTGAYAGTTVSHKGKAVPLHVTKAYA
jgi:hypothetical protein